MKKTTTLFLLLCLTLNSVFTQEFYITKRDFTNPSNYVHSLLELNQTTGATIQTYDYTSTFPGFNAVESLTYNSTTKEIFGISEGLILKYNIETDTESSFNLPALTSGDYQDVIIADNRLYVTRRDFSDPSNYVHSILELNQNTGSIINTYDFTASFPGFNSVESLTYNPTTKEVFGISDNLVLKYNIETKTETSFTLPELASGDYQDVVIASNRLFASRRDFSDPNNYVHSLLELNQSTGNIIGTYDYTTSFPGFSSVESLSYNPVTKEIFGISDNLVLKYNIETSNESSITLPELTSADYGAIMILTDDDTLSIDDFELSERTYKIINTYNLLGQEIPANTLNEIIIVLFENGSAKKVYNKG